MSKIDFIEIQGFKSIKSQKIVLNPINILIGANGAGKSNFISFFDFLQNLYKQSLEEYVALKRGTDKMLYRGKKITEEISAFISFNDGVNGYSFKLNEVDGRFIFMSEALHYIGKNPWSMTSRTTKAMIKTNNKGRGEYINKALKSFRKYHFHDTSKNSPFTRDSHIENDSYFLYEEGGNLPAFLYRIYTEHPKVYYRIISTIQSIAPYFSDFYYPENLNTIRLQWQDKYSSTTYGAVDLSDGTMRFIALATLFLQPKLPEVIVIDEPELGLHPVAIAKLAGLIKSAANSGTQVIVATQSADLINHFQAEDIITVDQINGESVFNRLEREDLTNWLDDYSIGDLWQRNIINAGQPNK